MKINDNNKARGLFSKKFDTNVSIHAILWIYSSTKLNCILNSGGKKNTYPFLLAQLLCTKQEERQERKRELEIEREEIKQIC